MFIQISVSTSEHQQVNDVSRVLSDTHLNNLNSFTVECNILVGLNAHVESYRGLFFFWEIARTDSLWISLNLVFLFSAFTARFPSIPSDQLCIDQITMWRNENWIRNNNLRLQINSRCLLEYILHTSRLKIVLYSCESSKNLVLKMTLSFSPSFFSPLLSGILYFELFIFSEIFINIFVDNLISLKMFSIQILFLNLFFLSLFLFVWSALLGH